MSWTDGVDWQQFNRDMQNVEMLRLQQEQNELLKKSLEKPQTSHSPGVMQAAAKAVEAEKFEALREAERHALETKDPNAFIEMGNWWNRNGNLEEARTSYTLAAKVCFVEKLPPAVLCMRIAEINEKLGHNEEARIWYEKGVATGDQNCLNSLIWAHLIPAQQWAEIDAHLERARSNDAGQATTGVISNAAISLYKRGKPDDAIKLFKVALERPDKSANGEAFWWMSKIFGEKNEVALSEDYYKLCQQAGGYTPPAWA
jgi:tetratricopeptide (TPR) repeat protein